MKTYCTVAWGKSIFSQKYLLQKEWHFKAKWWERTNFGFALKGPAVSETGCFTKRTLGFLYLVSLSQEGRRKMSILSLLCFQNVCQFLLSLPLLTCFLWLEMSRRRPLSLQMQNLVRCEAHPIALRSWLHARSCAVPKLAHNQFLDLERAHLHDDHNTDHDKQNPGQQECQSHSPLRFQARGLIICPLDLRNLFLFSFQSAWIHFISIFKFVSFSRFRVSTWILKSRASATGCRGPARSRPAGTNCPTSGRRAPVSRTNTMVPRWCTLTARAPS